MKRPRGPVEHGMRSVCMSNQGILRWRIEEKEKEGIVTRGASQVHTYA